MYTVCTSLLKENGIVDQVEFTPEEFEQYREQYEALWAAKNSPPDSSPAVQQVKKKRK